MARIFITGSADGLGQLAAKALIAPGWVPTRMGGRGAPDDLQKGYETQVWLVLMFTFKKGATKTQRHEVTQRNLRETLSLGVFVANCTGFVAES